MDTEINERIHDENDSMKEVTTVASVYREDEDDGALQVNDMLTMHEKQKEDDDEEHLVMKDIGEDKWNLNLKKVGKMTFIKGKTQKEKRKKSEKWCTKWQG